MKLLKSVILVAKPSLESLTPTLSLALLLSKLAENLIVVTSKCSEQTCKKLENNGVKVIQIEAKSFVRNKFFKLFNKIRFFLTFHSEVWRVYSKSGEDSLLWVASGDTALAIGRKIKKYNYILQLHELYDKHPVYRYLLKYYAQNAQAVVVPEDCRAAILRSWYQLPETPYVLPNKPYYHPRKRNLYVTDSTARKLLDEEIGKNTRIVLYQGDISPLRDIRPIAKAVRKLGPGWRFVVMGTDNHKFVEVIKQVYPELVHIQHISPPAHLEVTSHAYVGVAVYGFDMINAVFCAPNKIWEYAGFQIPMLCLDIPGLKYTVEAAGAGICSRMQDIDDIVRCLNSIDENYSDYSKQARKFFNSVDLEEAVRTIIHRATLCVE